MNWPKELGYNVVAVGSVFVHRRCSTGSYRFVDAIGDLATTPITILFARAQATEFNTLHDLPVARR